MHAHGAAAPILSGQVSGLCKSANNPKKAGNNPAKRIAPRLRVRTGTWTFLFPLFGEDKVAGASSTRLRIGDCA